MVAWGEIRIRSAGSRSDTYSFTRCTGIPHTRDRGGNPGQTSAGWMVMAVITVFLQARVKPVSQQRPRQQQPGICRPFHADAGSGWHQHLLACPGGKEGTGTVLQTSEGRRAVPRRRQGDASAQPPRPAVARHSGANAILSESRWCSRSRRPGACAGHMQGRGGMYRKAGHCIGPCGTRQWAGMACRRAGPLAAFL